MMQESGFHLQVRHQQYLCRTQKFICNQLSHAYQYRQGGSVFAAVVCYQTAYDHSRLLSRLAPEYSLLQTTSCALMLGHCYHQHGLTEQAIELYRQLARHLTYQRNHQARRRRLIQRCQSSVAQALHELME
ncbi:hypothetical protein HMF8227_02975 [Saliniradius amylolyticus]|uniref:Tetratricopeptide repeat protein n=1 Tax=Saliniradius amylolyticus TaxID=2183582 RepID=A0A2S2E6Z2_9ALTE|nr:hypothetical protein [Saliniradius amylolyticus]AWL13423.1 hypothetical protein HMF8227_02975 [Saliniradius amylolyticus]